MIGSSGPITPAAILRDPAWLAHRYDPQQDTIHFRRTPRAEHDRATFITDEYLGAAQPVVIRRADAIAAAPVPAPLHFILHSAFCCSTLLARAFDQPGNSASLKEPVILNDLTGWKHRGADRALLASVLGDALTLLARPFEAGEAVVVKPSNVTNGLARAMLALRPGARAVLLYAPLRVFLGSIARKGVWGRRWVRELMVKQLRDGLIDLGFEGEDYLELTDLQAAAVGWLAQQALFARLMAEFGPDRVRPADSERLLLAPGPHLARAAALFGIGIGENEAEAIAKGPIFARDAKTGGEFAPGRRAKEQYAAADAYADEIEKVSIWAEAVAKSANVSMQPGPPL